MSKPSLLIVGCGDLGQRVGRLLGPQGWHVCGVRRHPPLDTRNGIDEWITADYSKPGSLDFAESACPESVLVSPTPASMDVAGYRRGFTIATSNLINGLGKHRPRLLLMVSSTRVYAESDGGWVEESSALTTNDQRGVAIVEAERNFLDSEHAASVVRCGGIYGATGSRLLSKIAQGRVAPAQPLRYTNRIHRDDCARFLAHLIQRSQQGEAVARVYNAVDNNPAPAHEVESWIARQLGIATDHCGSVEEAGAVSHKRCRNVLLSRSGFELRYPDYKTGYGEICQKRMSEHR